MKFMKSYGVALIILLVIGAYMIGGTFVQGGKGPGNGEQPIIPGMELAEHESEGPDPHLTIAERNAQLHDSESSRRSVRIETFTQKAMPLEVSLRGTTEANAKVSMVAQTSAIVDQVHVTKGHSVAAGDLLCTLDQGTREAAVLQAKASLAKAQLDFDSNEKLRVKGLSPENSRSQYEAALEASKANLKQAEAELERTEIRAKIDGIIEDPVASVGELLSLGGTCATIVQLNPIKFVGAVPEGRIALAREGLPVTITTVNGQSAQGNVTYIASSADPATRSFTVEVEADNASHAIRDGITAEATVNMGILPAHQLPQSALTLDDEGRLGVRAVEDSTVVFHPIEIISDMRDGIWVSGLPSSVDVIVLGQEDVKAGQVVDARKAPEIAEASADDEEKSS